MWSNESNINIPIILATSIIIFTSIAESESNNILNLNLSESKEWVLQANFNLDQISSSFAISILTITLAVMLFSTFYMQEENKNKEFTILITIFVISIIIIISSPSILTIMLGWDGLGITSFCLVIFYQNQSSLASSIVTFYTNRMGDAALLSLIATSNESTLSNNSTSTNWQIILFAIAAATNSAQIPFSAWLPAAISAPTPTSSLVHSSTLVTAGLWILNRFSNLTNSDLVTNTTMTMAILTTVLAGNTAGSENDLNNIVAMSTLSQLGIIIICTAINIKSVSILHMNTHALFNALLFLTVGTNIESTEGSQNNKKLSISQSTASATAIKSATLTLISLPITSSFLSNDLILESFLQNGNITNALALLTTAVFTSMYSINIISEIANNNNSSNNDINSSSNSINLMVTAMVATSVLLITFSESQLYFTTNTEKLLWLIVTITALSNNENTNENSEDTLINFFSASIEQTSNNNNKENKTDNNINNSILNALNNNIIKVNKENKNVINESMVLITIIILLMNK